MADIRERTKQELKKLMAYDIARKGLTEKTLRIAIDLLWPNNFNSRTSGFEIAGSPDSTIDWDNGTRTFTIEPTDPEASSYTPEFGIYAFSTKPIYLTRDTAETLVLPNEEGLYAIHYDSSSTTREQEVTYTKNPTESETWEIYLRKIIIAWVYLNNAGSAIYFGDSRHGSEWNPQMHWTWHQTLNSLRQEGVFITDATYDGDGSLDSHYQFGISAGKVWHEDILVDVDAVSATASLPVWYFESGKPRYTSQAGTKFINSGRVAYNSGSIVEATNNYYVLYHLFATNDTLNPVISAMGQSEYQELNNAIEAAEGEVLTLRADLPHSNLMHIGSVILHTSDDYTNTAKARLISFDDKYVWDAEYDDELPSITLKRTGGLEDIEVLINLFAEMSIEGDGSSLLPFKLVNDEETPGVLHVYGTDASGVKGWFPLVIPDTGSSSSSSSASSASSGSSGSSGSSASSADETALIDNYLTGAEWDAVNERLILSRNNNLPDLYVSIDLPTEYTNKDWTMTEARNIEAGSADTFVIVMKARSQGFTITSLVHEVDNGSLTGVNVKIDGVAVTGLSSLTVSTTETETSATANNVVSAGQRVTLEITTGYTGTPTKILYQLNLDR